jgi:hypothetical protein
MEGEMTDTEPTQAESLRCCLLLINELSGNSEALVNEALRGIPSESIPLIYKNLTVLTSVLGLAVPPPLYFATMAQRGKEDFTGEDILSTAKHLPELQRKILRRVGDGHLTVEKAVQKLWSEGEKASAWHHSQRTKITSKPAKGRPKAVSVAQARATTSLVKAKLIKETPHSEEELKRYPGSTRGLSITPKGAAVYRVLSC